ncbi:MAG: DUF4325 domain-containing protein [Actinomycetota bacterium]
MSKRQTLGSTLARERRDVKELIRALLEGRTEISSAEVQAAAGITRQAAHYHLRDLVESGELEPPGRGRGARYRIPGRRVSRHRIEGLEESELWAKVVEADRYLSRLADNVLSILRYAFTEMVNNAIDHSRGTFVHVSNFWDDDHAFFEVADDGIGAFQSVRTKLDLPDDFAALQEISKGKTTTDPQHHTGEGIFFTSKTTDRFVLEANGLRWTVDNMLGDQAAGDSPPDHGTRVRWDVDAHTNRTIKSVFDLYADRDTLRFSRSRATISLFETATTFVSRSEAKRLSHGLERFEEVMVDFTGVREVGQGFVDELFRVWADEHPATRLIPVSMSPGVEAMVLRGLPDQGHR